MHMFCVNLWTFIDLCNLSGAFSDPVSNVYLNLLEMSFQQGVKTIFEKIDYMPIFCVGL